MTGHCLVIWCADSLLDTVEIRTTLPEAGATSWGYPSYDRFLRANRTTVRRGIEINWHYTLGYDSVFSYDRRTKGYKSVRRFFQQPRHPRHRLYEALRAYFLERRPPQLVARAFGYSVGYFHLLCHHFRRDPHPLFFVSPRPGPRSQPKKSAARDLLIRLRKQNYSVYEISHTLKEPGCPLSPTAVREVLREEGFAPLPRRLDEERPGYPRPTIQPVADVREFSLAPRTLTTRCGGLFLFVPDLVRLNSPRLASRAHLPGSKMIPAPHALRACLALKLWSLERKSHVMALVADQGLALFAGLNAIPKKSYLSEYSSRLDSTQTTRLLAGWQEQLEGRRLFPGESFNLDFHSIPYYGEDPGVERHYVSARSRRPPSILVFLAPRCRGTSFLLFPCRHPERRGIGGGLPLPGVLETRAGRLPPPARV